MNSPPHTALLQRSAQQEPNVGDMAHSIAWFRFCQIAVECRTSMVDRVSSRVGMVLVLVPTSGSRALQGSLQNSGSINAIDARFIFDSRKQYELDNTRFISGVLSAGSASGTGCRSNKQGAISGYSSTSSS